MRAGFDGAGGKVSTIGAAEYDVTTLKANDYFLDSKRASPAIPYELMVTDRSAETDTAKWVTRLYYPIM